ncbi:MAG: hypothetical protein ABIQ44_15720 [Chloroflexia bacterium]
MLNRVDEKGKVFTAHVRKMEVEVNIVTAQGFVHGYIHLQSGQRVKDLLNSPTEQFLAITRATIQLKSEVPKTSTKAAAAAPPKVTHAEFLALNKQYVISVVPVDEDKIERRRDEEYYIPR